MDRGAQVELPQVSFGPLVSQCPVAAAAAAYSFAAHGATTVQLSAPGAVVVLKPLVTPELMARLGTSDYFPSPERDAQCTGQSHLQFLCARHTVSGQACSLCSHGQWTSMRGL